MNKSLIIAKGNLGKSIFCFFIEDNLGKLVFRFLNLFSA
jgi:hypothetical protein